MTNNILVTGAGSGFGRGIAFKLANDISNHVIAAKETSSQIFELEQQANNLGIKNISFKKLDVTQDDDRHKALVWNIDTLVNNAGISQGGSVLDIPSKFV